VSGAAYLCALALAGVLAVAGLSKLSAPARTAATFAALGLPGPERSARLVPAVELSLAVALVVVPPVGAAGALAALAGFSVVLARSVRAGVQVGCGCFGSAGDEPVSFVELVRNGLLAVLALAALTTTGPATPGLADVILVSTAAVVALMVLELVRLKRDLGTVFDNTLAGERAERANR